MYHRGTHEVYCFHKLASPSICFGGGQRLLPHANLEMDRCGGRRYSRTRQGCSGDGVRVLLSAALCKEKTGAMRVRVTCDLQTRNEPSISCTPMGCAASALAAEKLVFMLCGLALGADSTRGPERKEKHSTGYFSWSLETGKNAVGGWTSSGLHHFPNTVPTESQT